MQAMIDHCDILLTAWVDERLVGVARAIADDCCCCYLADLAVDRVYQRRGIGRKLVEMLEQSLGGGILLLLLAAPEAKDYYPRIGFQPVLNAWHKPWPE